MKRMIIEPSKEPDFKYIHCMSNVRGNRVKVPGKLPFSFYFGSKRHEGDSESVHGIRIKLTPNPDKIIKQEFSYMELHGDYEFFQNNSGPRVSSKLVNTARNFFMKNKVLFSAVWEEEIDENDLRDYLEGRISLKDLIELSDFYEEYKDVLYQVENLKELEEVVREYNIFNMND